MDTNYSFSLQRRLKGAAPPLGIAVALGVLLILFGTWGTWRFWVLLVLTTLMLYRAASYLWYARNEVQIDAEGLSRSGRKVRFDGSELELRTVERDGQLAIHEVVLWGPRKDEGREGVGFDDSLQRFDRAVRALVAKVPEMRVKVTTVSDKDVQGERREQVLAPLRPTAAERALGELGRSALSVPPHLRN